MTEQSIRKTIVATEHLSKRVEACKKLFLALQKDKKQETSLQYIAEIADEVWFTTSFRQQKNKLDDDDNVSMKDESETAFLISRYNNLARALIDLNSDQGYSKGEYYERIWTDLSQLLYSATVDEKGAALYAILLDKRTPYYAVKPGMQMDNAQYGEIVEHVTTEINTARFILNLNTKQRTETANQLLDLLDSIESKEEKIVLMSQIVSLIQTEKTDDDD